MDCRSQVALGPNGDDRDLAGMFSNLVEKESHAVGMFAFRLLARVLGLGEYVGGLVVATRLHRMFFRPIAAR